MLVKYLHWIGIAACILLIVACFIPWAHYADINETFTGFYSFKNQYGRPGKLLTILASLIFVFMLLPKVWAKRANLFLAALTLGYAIKSYVLFTSCYNAYCPEKQAGIFLMLISAFVILLASVFPDMPAKEEERGI